MITISKYGSAWVAQAPYEQKDVLKEAGFRWHPAVCDRKPCDACKSAVGKSWYTISIEVAAKLRQYADDSCLQELQWFEQKCAESLEGSTTAWTDIEVPTKIPLLLFQRAGVEFIELHGGRALVADVPGAGKSAQAIGFLVRNPDALPAVICAPASIRIQWQREVSKFSDLTASVMAGKSSEKAMARAGVPVFAEADFRATIPGHHGLPSDVVIMSYESLARHRDSMFGMFNTLVLDEAQAIKEPKSKRSKAAIALSGVTENVILLTGTPLMNRPKELWNLTQAVDKGIFPSFFHFAKEFCNAHQVKVTRSKTVWDFDGASNLDRLSTVLRQRLMIRREKKDVLGELPGLQRVTIPILLDKEPARQDALIHKIKTAKAELDAWKHGLETLTPKDRELYLSRHAVEASKVRGLQGVILGELQELQIEIAKAKIPLAMERVMEMRADGAGPMLLFCHHHEVSGAVLQALDHFAIPAALIDGRTSAAERQQKVDMFQRGELEFLILGIMAAGTGLNLTAAQSVCFLQLPLRPTDVEQAEARASRRGNQNQVTSYFFVAAGTIEERIARMLDQKREVTNAAVGEAQRTLDEQGILDAILEDIGS